MTPNTILAAQGIVKSYATVRAVDDLSFHIDEGEIFALLGPNGAGKTSMVRMLTGLTQPDAGQIDYRGVGGRHNRIPGHELGYLPEERGLYQDQPVLKVLVYLGQLQGLSRGECRDRAMHWLERLELADRAGEKVGALSKGNQQKVQLISAILHRPRFAVMDEPFSGLDPLNQERLLELIAEFRREGMTVLLSAHQMALVERLADRILLMDHGRAAMAGTLKELREESGLGTSLVATFHEGIPDRFELPAESGRVTHLDRNRVRVELAGEGSLNALLARLEALGPISELKSETPTLHDIYVRAVGGPADYDEEAA